MKELTLESHAKVNLALKITGKLPDGYHQLETIFQRIGLKDMITLKESDGGITVTSDSGEVPQDETNLAYRAAEKILACCETPKGVSIHIQKKIPIGAGLGGGSSNAATVLRGLDTMWSLGIPKEELWTMARDLGADVPFFLYDNCALGLERGDVLQPIPNRCKFWMVLVYPNIFISTAWVYGNFSMKLTNNQNHIKILQFYLQGNEWGKVAETLENDLESVVFPAYPEIEQLKAELLDTGAVGALMSGSGSSVFGLFENSPSAAKAAEKMMSDNRLVFSTEFVG